MNKNCGYCLLHNYFIFPEKLNKKCRANKPINPGISYKRTRKNSNDYRCKYLIFINQEIERRKLHD